MSDTNLSNIEARRTTAKITWDGMDITASLQPYLLSVTYTDNENDQADDLEVELQDRNGTWLDSWLDEIIHTAGTPIVADTVTDEETDTKTYTVTAKDGLNVRSGPGTGYQILGTLPYGTSIKVSDVENGWAVHTYNGQKAYSSMNYLKLHTNSATSTPSAAKASTTKYIVQVNTALHVRSGPSTKYGIIGQLKNGTAIEVSEIKNGWATYTYNGQKAYSSVNYLRPANSSATSTSSSGTTTVTGGRTVPAEFTAYYPADNPMEGGKMAANGEKLEPSKRTCAVPRSVPLGTKITVQGTGTAYDGRTYRANDYGGAIIVRNDGTYCFDLLMASYDECENFGRRRGYAVLNGTPTGAVAQSQTATTRQASPVAAAATGNAATMRGRNVSSVKSSSSSSKDDDTQTVQVDEQPSSSLRFQMDIVRHHWTPNETEKTLSCGLFELDSVESSGPPATITIRGTSLPFGASVRRTPKSKAWESCTLSEIAAEIAKDAHLELLYETDINPSYSHIEQVQTSNIAFLSTLCHDAGLNLKASNGMLILFDCYAYEKKPPVFTLHRKGDKNSSYIDYSLQTSAAATQCTSCRVRYVRPDGGCVEGTAYVTGYDETSENNQQLEITAKVDNEEQAMTLAKNRLLLHNRYFKTAVFTLPGNPDLVAGEVVALEGWSIYDGNYVIEQAKHTVDDSGYTTQITLRWAQTAIVKQEPVKKESQKSDSSDSDDDDSDSWDFSDSSDSSTSSVDDEIGEAILKEGRNHVGTQFSMGGSEPGCFDCSGFVSWVINNATTRNVGRPTAQGLYDLSQKINRNELKPGDLVFFSHTYSTCPETVSHVGFYVSGTQMLHCGVSNGVSYTDFTTGSLGSHLYAFGRIR